jgi:hypothetical protein
VRLPISYGKIPSKWEKSKDDSRSSSFFRRLTAEQRRNNSGNREKRVENREKVERP